MTSNGRVEMSPALRNHSVRSVGTAVNKGWSLRGVDEHPNRLIDAKAESFRALVRTCLDTEVLAVVGEGSIVRSALSDVWKR